MNLKHAVAAIVCSLFLLPAYAGDYLSGEEIKSTFTGKTAIGQHLKKDEVVKSYFAEDGSYKRVLAGGSVKGTWWVDDGMLCVRVKGKTKDRCQRVRSDGAGGYEKVKMEKDIPIVHFKSLEDGDKT